MGRQSPKAGFGGRTQQAGTLVAATFLPITFQRSLMPRSALDQALVTGISTSLNYGLAALIQDSVEALALRSIGTADPARVDRHGWRGGARTAAWWVATTGLSGAIVGGLQELVGRRGDVQDRSIPVAPFAGAVLVAANDYRRRRWEAHHPWSEVEEHAPVSPAKSFAMSVGVTAGLMGLAAGERQFAAGVGGLLERALPGLSASTGRSATSPPSRSWEGRSTSCSAGSTAGSSGAPSRSRRPTTSRPPPGWSAEAPGARWPWPSWNAPAPSTASC